MTLTTRIPEDYRDGAVEVLRFAQRRLEQHEPQNGRFYLCTAIRIGGARTGNVSAAEMLIDYITDEIMPGQKHIRSTCRTLETCLLRAGAITLQQSWDVSLLDLCRGAWLDRMIEDLTTEDLTTEGTLP